MHPALTKDSVALITGGASGIGLSAAHRLGKMGLRVCIADIDVDPLAAARDSLEMAGHRVAAYPVDVSDRAQVQSLADRVQSDFGPVSLLLNNAGVQPGSSIFDDAGTWNRVLAVNLGGIVTVAQIFAPRMIASGLPGLIVNTGSKQGITTPPGDPAYNIAKAGVKVFTEALQHHLRTLPKCRVEARLFVPGFVFTPLTAQGRRDKPAGAWTPDQVVDYLLAALDRPDFYILCPDNDVARELDAKRIAWAAGDMIENRPPLSRWHPDYAAAFQDWLAQ